MYNPYDYYITDDEYAEAQKNGIHRVLLNNRIRVKGWGKKEAITTPLRRRRNLNEYYKNLARENGIGLETFASRIQLGWSNLQAATTPPMDPKEVLKMAREKQRKYPKELLETADKNGIKRRLFYTRIERGMTPEEAATIPLCSPGEKARRAVAKRKANGNTCLGGLGKSMTISGGD